MQNIKSIVGRNLTNALGWRTNRKIIVIESDDWGSIRVPDKKAINYLRSKGFAVDKCPYVMNDALESNEDLEILFEFIESRKKKPIITSNFLTANPSFKKIKESNFEKYYFENLEMTLNQYPNHDKVKKLWLEGTKNEYFSPQLHGREHLNISQWMGDLKRGNYETREAFKLGMFGISAHIVKVKRNSYQAALGIQKGEEVDFSQVLKDAFDEFEKLFGFKSRTFIAPNYTWDEKIEKITANLGITHLQGVSAQRIPKLIGDKPRIKRNFLGESNRYGQKYLIRNVSFEPFMNPNLDWVSCAMIEIRNAFFWNKPAIISMHRVNFIGSINENNRSQNLKLFNELLDKIDEYWPDVEFLSSKDLAKLI
ncbi:polysaccharide (de)acetylase [Aequorivita viscosa]|nr:polysaccharide (de)acetylase [Aequorivita viscosa]